MHANHSTILKREPDCKNLVKYNFLWSRKDNYIALSSFQTIKAQLWKKNSESVCALDNHILAAVPLLATGTELHPNFVDVNSATE